jgi:hypothetical protein
VNVSLYGASIGPYRHGSHEPTGGLHAKLAALHVHHADGLGLSQTRADHGEYTWCRHCGGVNAMLSGCKGGSGGRERGGVVSSCFTGRRGQSAGAIRPRSRLWTNKARLTTTTSTTAAQQPSQHSSPPLSTGHSPPTQSSNQRAQPHEPQPCPTTTTLATSGSPCPSSSSLASYPSSMCMHSDRMLIRNSWYVNWPV